jgi:glycosyltransferase involved in cell wall biosynthesis
MNVGIVTHYMPPHPGGIEQVAEGLFEGYATRGLGVRWVASRVPASAPAREGGRIRVACGNATERLLGVPLPLWGREGWRAVADLVRWADVLHVHDCLYPGTAMTVTLARRHRRPVLLSQHIGFVQYRRAALNLAESAAYATLGRAVLRRCAWIALATPAAEAYVASLLGELPATSCAIPNGIDTARFAPVEAPGRRAARIRLGLPQDGPVVLFAGRLVEKKGVPLVAAAIRRLPDVRFLVVGDGPLAHLIREPADNVTWLPRVEPARMTECYQAASCLLLPSHGEGLPLVVQEAMACGLPAIVSADEPFAGPLVADGVVLPVARDEDAVVARLGEALAAAGSDLPARARRHAVEHWSAGAMTARYVSLLERLAPAAARASGAAA